VGAKSAERGCECEGKSERVYKGGKVEESGPSMCYVRQLSLSLSLSVCVYSVGLQINPVGFILSEWDSGALQ